jgi:putative endonuclease
LSLPASRAPGPDEGRPEGKLRGEGRESMVLLDVCSSYTGHKMRNIQREYYVYMLASKRLGTFYVGVTNNLDVRVRQHKDDVVEGFTNRYGVHRLVWFETHGDIREAITREKQIKGWNRAWKIRLIEKGNPEWKDLYRGG